MKQFWETEAAAAAANNNNNNLFFWFSGIFFFSFFRNYLKEEITVRLSEMIDIGRSRPADHSRKRNYIKETEALALALRMHLMIKRASWDLTR